MREKELFCISKRERERDKSYKTRVKPKKKKLHYKELKCFHLVISSVFTQDFPWSDFLQLIEKIFR